MDATFDDLMFVRFQLDLEITGEESDIAVTEFFMEEGLSDNPEEDAEHLAHATNRLADLRKAREIVQGWLNAYLRQPKSQLPLASEDSDND